MNSVPQMSPKKQSLVETHPHLILEWCSSNSRAASATTHGSDYKATWVCSTDDSHTWVARVANRARGARCSICTGYRVRPGVNDLATKAPHLAAEWDYEANTERPEAVAANAERLYHWVCSEDHRWQATPNNRYRGRGCRVCVRQAVSSVEQQLCEALAARPEFTTAEATRVPVPFRTMSYMELDILATTTDGSKIAIEYDGAYWHKSRVDADIEKTQALLDAGYQVIRIREQARQDSLPLLGINHPSLSQLLYNNSYRTKDHELTDLVNTIAALA